MCLNAGLLFILGAASLLNSTEWMSWAVAGTCVCALGVLAPLAEPHARGDVARGECRTAADAPDVPAAVLGDVTAVK